MPELRIDGRRVRVPEGATLLQAARELGIEVPSLCFAQDLEHHTSCMVCLVEDLASGALLPACAARAAEGQEVRTDSERARAAQRASLELLLSEHAGDCEGPCARACPARADIPRAIRRLLAGDRRGALEVLLESLPLVWTLAHVCPAPCERSCRRKLLDSPVAIRALKRAAAEEGLASGRRPYTPVAAPPSGKTVAVVGAGPAGLAAAYFLARAGHRCLALDERSEPGGGLRQAGAPDGVLAADMALLERLGVRFEGGRKMEPGGEMEELRRSHDAVILAVGSAEALEALQPGALPPGLFIAGGRGHPSRLAVRAVAEGRRAAEHVGRFLDAGRSAEPPRRRFDSRLGVPSSEELAAIAARACARPDASAPADPVTVEAGRCLQCDCAKKVSCRLRQLAGCLEADARRFPGERLRAGGATGAGAAGGLSFEPGKCIRCGICVRIAQRAGDRPGLTFRGRGFDMRVAVPFNEDVQAALPATARECAARCPTGALVWRR